MPPLAPIGAAIAGATASIAGAATAVAPIISAGSSLFGFIRSAGALSAPKQSAALPNPITPNYDLIRANETSKILKANSKRTKNILTSPLSDVETNPGIILKKTLGGS